MPNLALDMPRAEFLAARESTGKVLVPAWPRPDKELRRVEVEVTWVRFSTLNHRTRAEQLRAINSSGRPDLFTADPLGTIAQQAQYEILASQEGFEDLKKDLRERGQQEPAIITADGILINGNRRSAALRSLYLKDHHLSSKYVSCLVLPQDALADELVDLEAELQVARDFKQQYSWINEALLIEELYDREGKSFDRVAQRMHRDVPSVRALHDKLQQAHQLVAMSQGARQLIDFNENESAFDELTKHIRNKSAPEAESVRTVYFLGTLANVQYRKLRHLRREDAADLVERELRENHALRPLLDLAMAPSFEHDPDDPLGDLVGPSAQPALSSVLALLAATKPEETLTFSDGSQVSAKNLLGSLQTAITAAAEEAGEEQKDQAAVKAPLARADKAIEELKRSIIALPKARSHSDWVESALSDRITEIRQLLNELGKVID